MKKTNRKTHRAIMALLIASIIAVCLPAAAAPQGATITSLAGTVKVIKAPGQKRIPAVVGMTLDENAEIMTGPNSSAVLNAGGGTIKIKALTSITISSLTSSGDNTTTALSVKKGSVLAKVDKMSKGSTFNVKTPTAVAGVRGTQFSVDVAPKSDGPGATLKSVKGKVELKKAKTSAWIAAKNGDKMTKGDTIRSGPDGNCVMAWGKGNVVVIKPLTQITVSELASGVPGSAGKNELTLATGKAIVNSKKESRGDSSFNIRTPSAVAGVRGTKFEVAVKGGDPTKDAAVSGKLIDVKGTVEVQQKGSTAWKKASENTSVSQGDSVRTKSGSSCVIAWGKGNVVRVADLALVRLDMMNTSPATGSDDSEIFVSSGKVFVKAKKIKGTASTFTVKTPSAVAGVRGTEFSVKSSGGNRENAGADTNNGGGQGKGNASDSESKAGDQGRGESKAYGQGGGGDTTTTTGNKPGGDSENKGGEQAGGDNKTGGETAENKGGGEREGGNRENAGEDTNNGGGQGKGGASDSESKAGEQGSGESKAFGQGDATGGGEQPPAGKTEILCAEGEVAVMSEDGDETSVSQGEKMDIAEGGDMSEPEPASQDEAAAFKAEGALDNPDFVNAGGEGYPQEKPGETEIMCSEGGVEVSTPDGANIIDVGAGEKTAVAEEAQPAAPAEMTNEEHTEIKSEKELDNPENLNTASTGEGDAPTTVKVLDGELAIESIDGSMIELGAGMKTDVVEGQAPQQPEPMSAEEIKTFQQEAAAIEQADTGGGAQGKTETTTKTETATTKTEPTKTEPTKTEPTKTEPTKTEPVKTESTTTTTKTETTGAGDTTTTKTETSTTGAGDTTTTKTETTTTGAGDTTTTGTGDTSTTTTTETTDTATTDTTATDTATDITDTAGTDAVMDTIVDQTTDSVVDTINVQNPASDIANELSNCTSGSCMQVHIEF